LQGQGVEALVDWGLLVRVSLETERMKACLRAEREVEGRHVDG